MSAPIKKNNVIFLAIFLLCSNIFAQQGWYNMNVSFGGGGIYFKDLNTGIVSGYKTTNGGSTWYYISLGSHLSFPDLNIGYSAGGSFIYKTTNFGDNWIQQNHPFTYYLYDINFSNINTGYSCGNNGSLIKTTNGGNNWVTVEPFSPPQLNDYNFTNVSFIDALTGYIAGWKHPADTSIFIKTTNGGINWSIQRYAVSNWGRFTSMFFVNANTGYIGSVGFSGYILKTINGGATWNQIILPTSNVINSLYFPSTTTGYGSCYGGQILKTTNGGNNWFLQTTGTGSVLYSIFFLNNLTGYCSGDNNTVLKTTDGGGPPIGIKPISNEVPKDFRLEQNYPNPFNPNTKVRFNIPSFVRRGAGVVVLKVYDILGNEVTTLVNDELTPGTYEADFDGSKYSSGVYYYSLRAGEFMQTRKMVLVR